MGELEPFTLIEEHKDNGPYHLWDDVLDLTSAKTADHDLQYVEKLRKEFPDYIVTGVPANNINLLGFAASGFASAERDKDTDSFWSWRGYTGPAAGSRNGQLAEAVHFAKYHYKWGSEDFILYTVPGVQYVLKERKSSEHPLGPSKVRPDHIRTLLNNLTLFCVLGNRRTDLSDWSLHPQRCCLGVRRILDPVKGSVPGSQESVLGQGDS